MPSRAKPGYIASVPLDDLLGDETAIVRLRAQTADEVLSELALALADQTGLSAQAIAKGLREREALGSTALGRGLALPHTKAELAGSRAVVGVAPQGIEFGAPDELPVRVFVALVSSLAPSEHLRALAAVSRTFADPAMLERLLAAEHPARMLAILRGEA